MRVLLVALLAVCVLVSGCSGPAKNGGNWSVSGGLGDDAHAKNCNGSITLLNATLDSFYNTLVLKLNNTGGMPLENFTAISTNILSEYRYKATRYSKPGQVFNISIPVRSDMQSIYVVSWECDEAVAGARDYEINNFNFSTQGNNTWRKQ